MMPKSNLPGTPRRSAYSLENSLQGTHSSAAWARPLADSRASSQYRAAYSRITHHSRERLRHLEIDDPIDGPRVRGLADPFRSPAHTQHQAALIFAGRRHQPAHLVPFDVPDKACVLDHSFSDRILRSRLRRRKRSVDEGERSH